MIPPVKPVQKIIFGSPGTGKSYQVRSLAENNLQISWSSDKKNIINTVFHPEYTYSDFIGKLLPQTQGNSVIYKFYPGHFLRALGRAYRNLIDSNENNCLLVIDELNRGNAAAIFGSIFQLLDREKDNCSSYEIDISELELVGLFNSMDYKANVTTDSIMQVDDTKFDKFCDELEFKLNNNPKKETRNSNKHGLRVLNQLRNRKISIPPNLSIIATINTSDESIYYLDSAFKRRWDWEYIEAPSSSLTRIPKPILETKLVIAEGTELEWHLCIVGLNNFIKSNYQSIRKIEDKQIGWWFIKPENGKIQLQQVKDKLMFYLWDSVFAKDKRPLEKLISEVLEKDVKLITFADLVQYTSEIMRRVYHTVDINNMIDSEIGEF